MIMNPLNRRGGITYISGRDREYTVTYAELLNRALHVLNLLRSKGIKTGEELLMQVEDNDMFITVFWACILGGIIPVPVTVGHNNEHKLKIFNIWSVLQRPHLIGTDKVISSLESYAQNNGLMETADVMRERAIDIGFDLEEWTGEDTISTESGIHYPNPDDIAFIQFSSGSTGNPKGVVLTHRNLIANLEAITAGAEIVREDKALSWLPLTHDMGLIGFHLGALANRVDLYLIPTDLFIRRPVLWFDKINEHRITITCSPNFGYKYFLQALRRGQEKQWDLSCVRLIFNGAEPISTEVCREFFEQMEQYHLHPSSLFNVYGLAEASLAVTFCPVNEGLTSIALDRSRLSIGDEIREVTKDEEHWSLVDLGYPVLHCQVRICGEDNEALPERRVGFVHIRGDNVTSGYYNNPDSSAEIMDRDGWLNTGDIGFMLHGRLIITGRAKEILFVNGRNYYPADVETVAMQIKGIELGKIAACGVWNQDLQRDELLIFIWHKRSVEEFAEIAAKVRKRISGIMGLQIDYVLPVTEMPKTTSGKIQRYALGQMYREGSFNSSIEQLNNLFVSSEPHALREPAVEEMEAELLAIWQTFCPDIHLGVHDNFFEAGMTSLMISQIAEHMEGKYSRHIKVADLFAHPTIAKMAKFISSPKSLGIPCIELSPHFFIDRGAVIKECVKEYRFVIEGESLQKIKELCKSQHTTFGEYIVFCYGMILAQLNDSENVLLNTMLERENLVELSMVDIARMEIQKGENAFQLEELDQLKLKKDQREAAVLIYEKALKSIPLSLTSYFDIVVELEDMVDEVSVVFSFQAQRMREKVMRDSFDHLAGMALHSVVEV
ncbi:non-ribosomal peptide synthetase [Paenibacillus melissococcoides]|uniref:Non-ribosomal peptide synthetase n=1 Tax=Paenibacillus melissococcoides TaxID=2912268 RepID=A0ABN8TXD0_9BACL|nr:MULTISPECIES: non-ribosomal peptide synthetase [Paenibacillus]MEB9895919.1 non-ribosomal peptide synthetase [Bacillus cereus]CAH8243389.1 non-ribosomal peptide synthetase [Paenibacillus melissococcoides]CAH8704368.1 non-ribosomal peptide synthetase [Paenibacillus melissococcoides]CAH8707637.1 non-ribosomal peptide synthetase [Paenibacillus melissococcoides]